MRALLWKDWRLVRPLLIAAGCMYLVPFVVWVAADFIGEGSLLPRKAGDVIVILTGLCIVGCGCSLLVCPFFTAVMFAKERRERSADLVGALPVARTNVVLSKSLIAALAMLAPWVVTVAVFLIGACLWRLVGLPPKDATFARAMDMDGISGMVFAFAGMATLGTGAGWIFSALARSEGVAGLLALIVTAATSISIAVILERLRLSESLGARPYYFVSFPMGVAAFVAGTVIALVRKTP